MYHSDPNADDCGLTVAEFFALLNAAPETVATLAAWGKATRDGMDAMAERADRVAAVASSAGEFA